MNNQVKTIDVDKMNLRGRVGACTEYAMYHKIRRKYILPIKEDIYNISKVISKEENFEKNYSNNRVKILTLFKYIKSSFDQYDMKSLLSKDLSNIDFIKKAYEIRIRNYKRAT
jgi:hypothetical protein